MLRERHPEGTIDEPGVHHAPTPDGDTFVDVSAGEPASTLNRRVVLVWLVSLAMVVIVGVLSVVIMRDQLRQHEIQRAVDDVRDRVDLVIEHEVNRDLVAGDPQALDEFDAVMREHIIRPTTAGIALWSGDGTILYALDRSFIGRQQGLPDGAAQAFDRFEVVAGTADEDGDEEVGWKSASAFEVYAPFVASDGERYVWEVGLRRDRITEQANRLVLIVALLTALGAAVLLTVQGILARNLVTRHDRERSYRRWLTQRVSEVATVERRQIAADLHDGVVQDLTGIALDLEVPVGGGSNQTPLTEPERSEFARRIRGAVTVLRGQAAELHPAASSRIDVERSLRDMLDRVPAHIHTHLHVDRGADVAPTYRWLVFRMAQESLRNAVQHSRASRIDISVRRAAAGTVVSVDDDGVGFSPESDPVEPGHMGLSLLSDMAAAAGAHLTIRSAPGKGTTIRLEVPG